MSSTRMPARWILIVAVLLPLSAAASAPDYEQLNVHARGLGPVELGMTVDEASQALELDIAEQAIQYTDGDCASYAFGESVYEWDLRMTAHKGRIMQIDIFTDSITTDQGVGLGARASELKQAHDGQYRVLPGRDKGESKLRIRTGADTVLEFVGRSPGPASPNSRDRAPPAQVRRYSVRLLDAGSSEGCL